jgi:hypothetical protein
MRQAVVAAVLVLSSGCATALSTFDTARTTERGHVRVSAAMGVHVPASRALDFIGEGKDVVDAVQARGGGRPTDEELARVGDAGIALMLQPLAPVQEFMIRTGVTPWMDVGLRAATTSLRFDSKARFWKSADDRKHASVGVGIAKYTFSNPIFKVLEYARVDDFSRWDLDAPLLFTFEYGQSFMMTLGAKYQLSRFTFSQKLYEATQTGEQEIGTPVVTDRITSPMHFFGGIFGMMAGYKYVFVSLELTAGWTRVKPRMYSLQTRTVEQRDLSGVTVYPAIGLVVKT